MQYMVVVGTDHYGPFDSEAAGKDFAKIFDGHCYPLEPPHATVTSTTYHADRRFNPFKKSWVVGLTASAKTLFREESGDEEDTNNMVVHTRVVCTGHPAKLKQVQSWLAEAKRVM